MKGSTLLVALLVTASVSSAQELAPAWPQFRGPRFDNNFPGQHPPSEFGPNKNILWKAVIPFGQGSPCIVGERIFFTAYDGHDALQTLAMSRKDGSVLWHRDIKPSKFEPYLAKYGTPAPSTCASDGKSVVAYFGSFGFLCYDVNGNEQWRVPMPLPQTKDGFGSGSSPIIYKGLVYLLRDEDGPGQGLYAFDLKTGKEVWKRKRDGFRVSFGSPVIWDNSVVVIGDLRVKGYDPRSGADRWVVRGLSAYPCTTPAPGDDGNLYVATWSNGSSNERNMPPWKDFLAQMDRDKDGRLTASDAEGTFLADFFSVFDKNKNGEVEETEWQTSMEFMERGKNVVMAIKPGGQDDITGTHVIWSNEKGAPYVASPLYSAGRLYLVKTGGLLTIYEAATGKLLLDKERLGVDGDYYASPIAADGKIFIASLSGSVLVLNAGDHLDILSKTDLGELIGATPAIVDDTLYIRSATHLWAFRSSPDKDRAR